MGKQVSKVLHEPRANAMIPIVFVLAKLEEKNAIKKFLHFF